MFGKDFKRQRANQPIQARTINQGLGPLAGLMKLRVGPGLELKWLNGIPLIWSTSTTAFKVFFTTSAITTASSTGSTVSNYVFSAGSGTARQCAKSGTGATAQWKPDTGTVDDTILNLVKLSASIPSGRLVVCGLVDGEWIVFLVESCS